MTWRPGSFHVIAGVVKVTLILIHMFFISAGLLERPVVIEGGRKRERKKTARLELNMPVSTSDKKIEIPEGAGTKLGEIPRG